MNSQSVIQGFLMNRLVEAQKKNASFSVRSLAKKANLSISAMSEILRGKRVVTRKTAEKIADRFLLDPSERFELLRFFPEKKKVSKNTRQLVKDELQKSAPLKGELLNYAKLSVDQFQMISHWLHFAILSLIQTRGFKYDPAWISDRLGVSIREVNVALERLQRLELVEQTAKGLKRKTVKLSTSDNLFDVSIQRSHLSDLEMGRVAIEEVPTELRDFTSITFPANPVKLKKAQEIIRRAQQEVVNLMADDDAEEVYRLSSMLIPLTRINRGITK